MPKQRKVSKTDRVRDHVFTVNNWTPAHVAHLDEVSKRCRYMIYGKEVGEEGTPHLQGYLYLKSAATHYAVAKLLGIGWTAPAEGSALHNQAYCSKQGDVKETGEIPKQGKRTDITKYVEAVQESDGKMTEHTLLTEHANMVCKYPTFVSRVQNHFHPPVAVKVQHNFWVYGPAGTGKTHFGKQFGSWYKKQPTIWFSNYLGEDTIIVDDLEPRHLRDMFWYLKIWGDYDPFEAQVKNGCLVIRPKTIVVTSNYSIDELPLDDRSKVALRRRYREVSKTEIFDYEKWKEQQKKAESE